MKDKKNIVKLLGVLFLSILSMIFLFKNNNIDQLLKIMLNINPYYLIIAGVSFFSYLLMESLAFKYLLKKQGYVIRVKRGIGYALADSFFSNISPGGSAGQPGQFYYMHKDGISTASCMMSLTAFNSMYHVAMIIFVIFAYFTGSVGFVESAPGMKMMILYGVVSQIAFVIFQLAMMFSKRSLKVVIDGFFRFIGKYKTFKRISNKEEKVLKQLEEFKVYGEYLKKNPFVFVKVLVYDLLLLISLYSISYWVYKAMGLSTMNFFQIIGLQAVLHVAVESLPIPGGVGISESSLLSIYSGIVPSTQAFGWMLVTRSFNFYTGLLFGAMVVFFMKKRNLESREVLKKRKLILENRKLNTEIVKYGKIGLSNS